ncbi:MAG TPA: hypothetical protein VND62_03150 [Acidimicrobiales bacterium]|nr:hypothetical protein [Acidimicrobiales bacterium]
MVPPGTGHAVAAHVVAAHAVAAHVVAAHAVAAHVVAAHAVAGGRAAPWPGSELCVPHVAFLPVAAIV